MLILNFDVKVICAHCREELESYQTWENKRPIINVYKCYECQRKEQNSNVLEEKKED